VVPPPYGRDFLEWLRGTSERAWAVVAERTLADFERAGVGGTSWRRGTRWTGGLSDAEVDEVERRHGVRFPADYRLFLRVLHATTPRLRRAGFSDHHRLVESEAPGFFDWRHDDGAIRAALEGVRDGILFDVEHGIWHSGWGTRPESAEERVRVVEALWAGAPKLIPVVGHRFLLSVEPHVVLSVHQTDVIVYGADLRSFLLAELGSLLGVGSDDRGADPDLAHVPFWGELVG
jgi:hypothetical protein